jgi:hypothetical protein
MDVLSGVRTLIPCTLARGHTLPTLALLSIRPGAARAQAGHCAAVSLTRHARTATGRCSSMRLSKPIRRRFGCGARSAFRSLPRCRRRHTGTLASISFTRGFEPRAANPNSATAQPPAAAPTLRICARRGFHQHTTVRAQSGGSRALATDQPQSLSVIGTLTRRVSYRRLGACALTTSAPWSARPIGQFCSLRSLPRHRLGCVVSGSACGDGGCRSAEPGRRSGGLRFPGALAADAQHSNTDQQMPFRNRWSSSTSSRIASGSWSRCHWHSSRPAASASACGAAARAALIA